MKEKTVKYKIIGKDRNKAIYGSLAALPLF
jgi:hypothetical protein